MLGRGRRLILEAVLKNILQVLVLYTQIKEYWHALTSVLWNSKDACKFF